MVADAWGNAEKRRSGGEGGWLGSLVLAGVGLAVVGLGLSWVWPKAAVAMVEATAGGEPKVAAAAAATAAAAAGSTAAALSETL